MVLVRTAKLYEIPPGGGTMRRVIGFTAERQDDQSSLETLLRKRMGLTRAQIRRAKFTENGITVNGRRHRVTDMVQAGDLIQVLLEDVTVPRTETAESWEDLRILYEDEDVLAVCKPSGLTCHPAHGHFRDTLANQTAAYLAAKGENCAVREVGRLDRDTSGIVVTAKNQTSAARLAAQREDGRMRKLYLAAAEGVFGEKQGCIRMPIAPDENELNKMTVQNKGKMAVTHYRVIDQKEEAALVCCRLETGRTHQIRVHMAAMGHPLLGDTIYGKGNLTGSRLGLHAAVLQFVQPFTGKQICLAAEFTDAPAFGTIDTETIRRILAPDWER